MVLAPPDLLLIVHGADRGTIGVPVSDLVCSAATAKAGRVVVLLALLVGIGRGGAGTAGITMMRLSSGPSTCLLAGQRVLPAHILGVLRSGVLAGVTVGRVGRLHGGGFAQNHLAELLVGDPVIAIRTDQEGLPECCMEVDQQYENPKLERQDEPQLGLDLLNLGDRLLGIAVAQIATGQAVEKREERVVGRPGTGGHGCDEEVPRSGVCYAVGQSVGRRSSGQQREDDRHPVLVGDVQGPHSVDQQANPVSPRSSTISVEGLGCGDQCSLGCGHPVVDAKHRRCQGGHCLNH